MSKNSNRIKSKVLSILDRYVRGVASAEQQHFVDRLYQQIGGEVDDEKIDFDRVEQEIKNNIDQHVSRRYTIRTLYRHPYIRIAAVLFVICSIALIILRRNVSNISPDHPHTATTERDSPILSIGNVRSYDLAENTADSLSYRIIDDQKVLLLSTLTEDIAANDPRKISNPTKQVFTFLLDDGSQVWLNAHSSIEFMPSFGKTERTVYVSGEVSLDVTKKIVDGKLLPFYVKTPLQTIEVVGTQFSINTQQADEESVVLLEGKIKLDHNVYKTTVVLEPNQKAFLSTKDNRILVAPADENNKVRAWRKGLFYFEGEGMSAVMKELSQWYEQPIRVDQSIQDLPITGMITRYGNLKDVLQILEMTNNIAFVEKKGVIYVTANE